MNRFDSLDESVPNFTQTEIEGDFQCQTNGCPETVSVAIFIAEHRVLTWKCLNEHKSYIEDVKFL